MTVPESPVSGRAEQSASANQHHESGGYSFVFVTGGTGEAIPATGDFAETTLAAAQAAMGRDIDVILGRIDQTIAREKQAINSLLHRMARY